MRQLMIFLKLCYSSFLFSQNVGVGTTNPQERLDVNGNINVTGAIKADGIAGQPGQILTTNNAGKIQWSNNNTGTDFGYTRFVGLYGFIDSNETWSVPNGVTKILVEAWGGGGGGSYGGGGGGGGYVRAQFNVSAGTVVNITVGKGGAANAHNNTEYGHPGGTTVVTVPDTSNTTWFVVATGGAGAYNNPGISFISSYNQGGSYYVANQYPVIGPGLSIYPSFVGESGEAGCPSYYTYTQTGTSTFLQEVTGGKGGDAGNSIKTGGAGGRNLTDGGPTIASRYAGWIGVFGGGGGGGIQNFVSGREGGNGKVIIWY
jgi:hypothetical protein